ncbi:MAG: trypsin-like peptidase domain-containing protein [Mycobacterium sp.]
MSAIRPADCGHCDVSALPIVDALGSALDQAATRAMPSIVSLDTEAGRPSTVGSGIIFTADGLILTASHVLNAGTRANGPGALLATLADGRTVPLSVVGTDPTTDVAVLRAEGGSGYPPIALGSSGGLRVGQRVAALGSPLGLENSVTSGIISALNRPIPIVVDDRGRTTVLDTIQTDAATTYGSSGGALIDTDGRLVGVNSLNAIRGVAFALPIDEVLRIADELVGTGTATHAFLGVRLGAPESETRGAVVLSTAPNSPAAAAGLNPGTLITRIDDRVIANPEGLIAAVLSKAPGDAVRATYIDSAGDRRTVVVVLASDQASTTPSDTPGASLGISARAPDVVASTPTWTA